MATVATVIEQQTIRAQHHSKQLFHHTHQESQNHSIPHSYHPTHTQTQTSSPPFTQKGSLLANPNRKRSPRRTGQEGLGAAMGTVLNSKSPGLAAKMSAVQYMDMSPIPSSRILGSSIAISNMSMSPSILQETPSRSNLRGGIEEEEDENLPPGSAMKIDSPYSSVDQATSSTTNKPMTRRKAGSLGRLFGTELSQHCNPNNNGGILGSNTLPLNAHATKHASLGCVFGGGNDLMTATSNPNRFSGPAFLPTASAKMTVAEDMSISMDSSFGGVGDYSIEEASPSIQCRIRQQGQLMTAIIGTGTKKFQSQSPPNKMKQQPSTSQNELPNIRLSSNFDPEESPIVPNKSRPNLFRRPSKDDSSPLGYGKRFASFTARSGQGAALAMGFHLDTTQGSPRSPTSASKRITADGSMIMAGNGTLTENQFLPNFGASEREGKILPCFNVKDDGLMRITADTLLDVLNGQYDDKMDGYQIVDCRFGYEFKGGHIEGAINLSTIDQVKKTFLHIEPESSSSSSSTSSEDELAMKRKIESLPPRTQSGKPDMHGNVRKRVLIFHCEFSMKRAPSSALALRQADRALAHDYPNCHYPEVYILQGGYSGFFTRFRGQQCQPAAYIQMDDPKYQQFRSKELNGFRKQFSRHRSFTYGDSRQMSRSSETGLMLPPPTGQSGQNGRTIGGMTNSIKEEDSSFDQSGGSPSALQANALMARRKGLMRHATASCTLGSAPNLPTANTLGNTRTTNNSNNQKLQQSPSLGVKPILTDRMRNIAEKSGPTCVGDLSFDDSCSIGDDSTSFEGEGGVGGGIGDSPCAMASLAVGGNQSRRLPALAPGPRPPMMPSFSTSTATARLQSRAPRRTASSNSFTAAINSMDR